MFCKILSGGIVGVSAHAVWVEVDMDHGLPFFSLVGSLGNEVRESRERVSVALKNAGFGLPASRVTVNLSPADLHKEGTAYDLPIAVGILAAMELFERNAAEGILFVGELGLNGEIKPVKGVLPIVRAAAKLGVKECIVPDANVAEGAVVPEMIVRGAKDIEQVVHFLQEERAETRENILPRVVMDGQQQFEAFATKAPNFSQVQGQPMARRAAEIAAAGFHNLLMIGPPGAGKSMIAKRIPGILPPLSLEESLQVSEIYSVAGLLKEGQPLILQRPFQSPHHTTSYAALIGGTSRPKPGLISLSHRGVLFLDEMPEFRRDVLDSLRQPMEEKQVQISRASGTVLYPAEFMLVAAMNPCPCGFYPDRNRCKCTEVQIMRYRNKVSGPILDRIDLWVELSAVKLKNLQQIGQEESSEEIEKRVMRARCVQEERFQGTGYRFNADIQGEDLELFCGLSLPCKNLMEQLYHGLGLGARAYHKVIKVARTIADLNGDEQIREEHLLEAAGYRAN